MSQTLTLRPYQREAIDAVQAAWAEGMQRPAVVLATGMGKAQPVDEPVLTRRGWAKIGDLSIGDEVIGSDGLPAKVTGVFPQGTRPTVVVEFTDGTGVRCDTDHLWTVQTRFMKHDAKRRGSAAWKTLTASELAEAPGTWYVPVVRPVEYGPGEDLPLDPYTLGVLLGDGGLSVPTDLRLHTRHDIVPLLSLPAGHRVTLYRDQGVMGNYRIASGIGRSANRVKNALRDLGLLGHTAHSKFVPEAYLRARPADRLAVLQGLLDTDGCAAGNGVEYSSVSKALADGVAELVRSLGGYCRIAEKRTSWTHQGEKRHGTAYRAYIKLPRDVAPFRVQRKAEALAGGQQFDPVKKIKSVTPGPDLECVCISVDAPDHLYVTTGYALTHNTVVFARMAAEHVAEHGTRVVILVHRDELADQTLDKLKQTEPGLFTGKVKASADNIAADVMVCSVQTLAREKRLHRLLDSQEKCGRIGLVIVDECHHSSAVSYRNILAALGCYSGMPGTRCAGFTATLARGDGQGLGDVWEDAVFTRSPLWAMSRGFLTDVKSKLIDVDTLHLDRVKKSGGDYQDKALGDAMMEAGGPQIIRKVLAEHAADRRSPIVFTPTVEVARATAEALPDAAYVHGGTPREERLNIYRKFRTGEVRTLVNCMILTEGADFPFADCVVVARPTRSQPLFQQIVGRVLRPSPATGKTDALVLILAGEGGSLCTLVDLEPGFEGAVRDGETLAEAYEREESRKESKVPAGSLRFELKHRDIDLFKASTAYSWLRTHAGVQFIPLGDNGEILLWPSRAEQEKWDVAYVPPGADYVAVMSGRASWEKLHEGLDLGMAMAWAETEAMDRSSLNMTKSAAWRKKPATPKQIGLLRYAGVKVPNDIRAGLAADLFAVTIASRKLDRFVPRS